jgi:hypothetical protein
MEWDQGISVLKPALIVIDCKSLCFQSKGYNIIRVLYPKIFQKPDYISHWNSRKFSQKAGS